MRPQFFTSSNAGSRSGEPGFVYDAKAEAKLRRKIDFVVVPTVSILYLFCFIDRANIGNDFPRAGRRACFPPQLASEKNPPIVSPPRRS